MFTELLAREECRRDSYKLLSECYYLPEENLLSRLGSLDRSRGELFSEITQRIPQLTDMESLQIDFSGLFVGPYVLLAPPYGSVYLENKRMVMGESTLDVISQYKDEELDIGIKEAPDHIAIELEFMYFLIFREIEAIRNGQYDDAVKFLAKEKAFLTHHLSTWVPDFTDNIKKHAQTKFYQDLAHLTDSFVLKDLETVSDDSIIDVLRVRLEV
ncbi:MAG: molecular chaperone TorD family protein [Chloroflexi bacterium]|nr:molecular chaperone TorD family protein [Chloroflexota bacterium]